MTSLEILDHLIRYVRLGEDLHIVRALERRDAGCRQCRCAEDPRVAGDLLGAGPTAHRLQRRRRAAQTPHWIIIFFPCTAVSSFPWLIRAENAHEVEAYRVPNPSDVANRLAANVRGVRP